MLTATDNKMLEEIAGLHGIPQGAYNIRKDGVGIARQSVKGIDIIPKEDKPGINIIVAPGITKQSIHIPVILSQPGLSDMVYNTFEIGEDADVLIVAGCGIHNTGNQKSQHDGIHEFFVHKNAKVRYVEKHYGEGGETSERVLNPTTILHLDEGAYVEMEMVQVRGVTNTERKTEIYQAEQSRTVVNERLLTHGKQYAVSEITVHMQGDNSSAEILSRSVAQDDSVQVFKAGLIGYTKCKGHVACDSIIMNNADIRSMPELWAKSGDAELTHEASIGKLAGDQILKLMTFGLSEEEAIKRLLDGYLK